MAIKNTQRGFALLISLIFMSVMLLFGVALASISYKQLVLASSAVESQYAFYAADAALECALHADQKNNLFAYPASDPPSAPAMTCDGVAPISTSKNWSASPAQWIVTQRFSFDSGKRCADVTVYKYSAPQPPDNTTTRLFSQGYSVPCTTVTNPLGARFVSRGLKSRY